MPGFVLVLDEERIETRERTREAMEKLSGKTLTEIEVLRHELRLPMRNLVVNELGDGCLSLCRPRPCRQRQSARGSRKVQGGFRR